MRRFGCLFSTLFALVGTNPARAGVDVVLVIRAGTELPILTRQQVSDIYHLKLRQLANGLAVTPLVNAAAKNEFLAGTLERSEAQMRAHWAMVAFTGQGSAPRILPGSAEIKRAIAEKPGVIGFIERDALDASVRVIYP